MFTRTQIHTLTPRERKYNENCGTNNGLILKLVVLSKVVLNALLVGQVTKENKYLFILVLLGRNLDNFQLLQMQMMNG